MSLLKVRSLRNREGDSYSYNVWLLKRWVFCYMITFIDCTVTV